MLQALEQAITQGNTDPQKQIDLQDYLCGILQVILVKVGHQVSESEAPKIVELLIMMFKQRGKVTENGLIAFSGLCNGVGEKIEIN